MSYKGKYIPKNPQKYKGDPSQVVYRSLWERKFMVYCDKNDKVVEWGSEEIIVPYRSPWDGKMHRYFPDMSYSRWLILHRIWNYSDNR